MVLIMEKEEVHPSLLGHLRTPLGLHDCLSLLLSLLDGTSGVPCLISGD